MGASILHLRWAGGWREYETVGIFFRRQAPDYSMSNTTTVSVRMADAVADLDFLRMVVEQEDKLGTLPIDSLIILSRLREERRLGTAEFVPSVQKPVKNRGAVIQTGERKGAVYALKC